MSTESTLTGALSSFDAALQAGRLAQAYLVVGNIRDEGLPFAEQALMRLFCGGSRVPATPHRRPFTPWSLTRCLKKPHETTNQGSSNSHPRVEWAAILSAGKGVE